MPTISDQTLLAGLATGDPELAAAFIRRFQRRLFGLAFTIVGDRGAAEEVAQDAFMRAWAHASVFDPRRGSLEAWLLTITRNLAIDALRMRRPQPADPQRVIRLESSLDDGTGPSERGEAKILLRAALGGLPSEQRRSLLLAAFFGYSAREIGEMEGIPVGTAKTRIRSAMIRVRQALASEEA